MFTSSFSKVSKKSKNTLNASSPEKKQKKSKSKDGSPKSRQAGHPEFSEGGTSFKDSKLVQQFPSFDHLMDDLPSFEMHNSLLNRTFQATDSPSHDFSANFSSTDGNQSGLSENLPVRPSLVTHGTATSLTRFQNSNQDSILNNLNSLAKVNAPLNITIKLTTKRGDGKRSTLLEPMLKEFTTGDIVAGIVTARNTSSKPIKFDMFTVSLEGYAKVLTGSGSSNLKYYTHTFLNMFDLNASFHTCNLSESNTLKIDPSDGFYIGLPVDKVFRPNVTYKKSFTFKFPSVLLDHVCTHQHDAHFMLPPTFGLDRSSMDGRAEKIGINGNSGYGVLYEPGSPILTRDLSYANESISYAIKARALSKKEDNEVQDGEFNRTILAESEHHLRFIPANAYDNPANYELSTDVQFKMLKKSIDSNICKLEQHYQLIHFGIEPNDMDYNLSRMYFNEKNSEKKLDRYCYQNNISLQYDVENLDGSERKKSPDVKQFQNRKVYEEEAFELKKQSMMSIPISNKRSQNGFMRMRAKIPSTGLTYIRPRFCTPSVEQSKKIGLNLQVIELELEYVPPMNCHTMNASKMIKPPQQDVEIKDILLETVTYRSIEPVPVTFAKFSFAKEDELAEHKKDFLTFQKRLDKLPKKFVHANMPKQTLRDIKAMVDLRYHTNNIKVLKIKSQVQEKWRPIEILEEDRPSPKSTPTSPLYEKSTSYFPPAETYVESRANSFSSQIGEKNSSKIKWSKKIVIEIDFNYQQDFKNLVLVPTFSTCLLGRLYGIVINVDLHSYGVKSLNVPIKVYNMGV
ncbi:hypothetical protein LJB42_004440 [Komagataella kurtzmanii]|nr:hypothetical protein LJB42_004440 [Komagataella kurtzmanii]